MEWKYKKQNSCGVDSSGTVVKWKHKQNSCWVDTGSARGVETLYSRRIVERRHYKQHSCWVDTGAVKEEILEKLEKL